MSVHCLAGGINRRRSAIIIDRIRISTGSFILSQRSRPMVRPILGQNPLLHRLHRKIHLRHRRLRFRPDIMQRRRRSAAGVPDRIHSRWLRRKRFLRREFGGRIQPAAFRHPTRWSELQDLKLSGERERRLPAGAGDERG